MVVRKHVLTGKTLAIAIGIIVVLGIVAAVTIPMFQTNYRNTERIRHLNQLAEALINWQELNQGALPTAAEIQGFELLSDIQDPDGEDYQIVLYEKSGSATIDAITTQQTSVDYTIYIYYSASCSSDVPTTVSNSQKFAVFYKLEGRTYCVDNATQ